MDKPDFSIGRHVGVGIALVVVICVVALIAAVVT